MQVRELKYYKWIFNENKITLVNKKSGQVFDLSMATADSFSRACISFRNRYRIEQVKKWKKYSKNLKEAYGKRIKMLKDKKNGKESN